ncbi:hypothetical protein KJ652_03815 [Patescibacteria group bacterium]|nr:hypothetical protein [Patescibacteria group bacterium]
MGDYGVVISEIMDKVVDLIRSMLTDAARELKTRLSVLEYQLFFSEGNNRIVSKKRSRSICENDVLVSLDPSVAEYAYLNNAIDTHALQRGILAFTVSSVLEDLHRIIGSKRTPVFAMDGANVSYAKLPRLFPMHIPLNDDDEAIRRDGNIAIMERALRYPDIPTLDSNRDEFTEIFVSNADSRESQDDFRQYLVSE